MAKPSNAAWLWDSDPARIVPLAKLRDAELTNSDYFGVILIPISTGRTGSSSRPRRPGSSTTVRW
jgi:hypothetical protein